MQDGDVSDWAQASKAVVATNAFGIELYKQLAAENNKNIFFSPYSISNAISILKSENIGEVKEETDWAVNFGPDAQENFKALRDVMSSVKPEENVSERLFISNALWFNYKIPLDEDYIIKLNESNNTEILPVNYSQPVIAADIINAMVNIRTLGGVKNCVPPMFLNREISMILTSAAYFDIDWRLILPEVKEDLFYGEETQNIAMMRSFEFPFRCVKSEDLQILRIPCFYNISMYILLPNRKDGLQEIEGALSVEYLDALIKRVMQKATRGLHVVSLPMLEFDLGYELSGYFKDMARDEAFNVPLHDSEYVSGQLPAVNYIFHKSFLSLNKIKTKNSEKFLKEYVFFLRQVFPWPEVTNFSANHPFLFFIRSDVTGCILFIGRYTGK
jgi:serpin B